MKVKHVILLFLIIVQISVKAQVSDEERYVPVTDPLVLAKLDQWQDLKFGLLMHWGPYSQWGIVESWSLCPEDYGWCQRKEGENPQNYYAYKAEYEGLKKTFNPVKFSPDTWAKAAKNAGMKYMVFTTKHHDGFTMYDSKYTDYKVTDPECAFSDNPKSNIALEVFDAFRNEGLWAGAYFSKPDWHSENYWDPYFPPFDRNVNYDPGLYPDKWEKYVQFTHNQILELVTDLGKVDILWLDGGWVKKRSTENVTTNYNEKFEEAGEGGFIKHRIVDQDIRMDELVTKVRDKQPGIIVVDRAVYGVNQNYLTPENRVPEASLPYPWESCIISGGGWSFNPNAKYMSGREAIHMLVDIVAKGGNLLLNVAPGPDGEWQQGAYDLLEEYGKWMTVNGEAIYNTRAIVPFKENNICLTEGKNGEVYFIFMESKDNMGMPGEILINSKKPAKGAVVTMLGNKQKLKWSYSGDGFKVVIPSSIRNNQPADYAWTIKVSEID